MNTLKTQINEKRCKNTMERHTLPLSAACPVSGNPGPNSVVEICYQPGEFHLEVASLRTYIDSYQGGREDVRSMEGMIQQIAKDCCSVLQTQVFVHAFLHINNDDQIMQLTCMHE